MDTPFPCDGCGECCKHVGWNKLLPSTNGVCDHLIDGRCSIYATRPLFCRVDDWFTAKGGAATREAWHAQNHVACLELKQFLKPAEVNHGNEESQ